MPNHVTNYIHITSTPEKIRDLFSRAHLDRNTDPEHANRFDFNAFIPMPDELAETGSPTEVVSTQAEANKINEEFLARPFSDSTTVKAITEQEARRREQVYGRSDTRFGDPRILNWYDWSTPHWGTKWNAYDVHYIDSTPTSVTLKFDTAWASPTPVFDHLTQEGYEVNAWWSDEGGPTGEYGDPYEIFEIDTSPTVEYAGKEI